MRSSFSKKMRFQIPKEYRKIPEAKELIRLDKEFSKACAQDLRALKRYYLNRDPDALSKCTSRTSKLQEQLQQAEEAYDNATGEPKPIALSESTKNQIKESFKHTNLKDIERKLAKTLAYMIRNGWTDPRIPDAILKMSDGDPACFDVACEQAKTDYRDLLIAAGM